MLKNIFIKKSARDAAAITDPRPVFHLSPYFLGELVWSQIFCSLETELETIGADLKEISTICEAKRQYMDYKTGSIPLASMLCLYGAARHARARSAFEIGTFIGKSTLSMAKAIEAGGGGQIYTCDGSNDFNIPVEKTTTSIVGFGKTSSTDALKAAQTRNQKFDFIHIDGRIRQDDIPLLESILEPHATIALDDFEGMEKGVANLSLLRKQPRFGEYILAYPISDKLLGRIGCIERSTTALLIHSSHFEFTNQ